MEILSKLPITTIRNCRCVCSNFRNLISDPEFAELHLPTSKPHLLYRGDVCTDDTLFTLNLPEGLEVLSSCNGTNQYKVLRFLTPSMGLIKLEAEINTLGTDLWRRVGDAPRYMHWYSGGCFLNGALHWIVHGTENRFESMCCFDFGKERFQPFPGPSNFRGLRVESMNMGVLKDGLSVFYRTTIQTLDLWVMKDYAVFASTLIGTFLLFGKNIIVESKASVLADVGCHLAFSLLQCSFSFTCPLQAPSRQKLCEGASGRWWSRNE
ncbi:putative F-box protein At4g09790 [Rhododendron vialii]|uniref:putative F-box protein At4g09790 n=1 Tax=Rhododendron vialii TaxID=182163 RepID=UPI00265E4D2D|nr:putative F-box protein At4g09790 [Rhododendron vialii]